jgi:hypothetical protein
LTAGRVPTNSDEALQQVQAAGPCVVFVPLWSLAAGELACSRARSTTPTSQNHVGHANGMSA